MYTQLTIDEFLKQTASIKHMPGGGCCAALLGATATSLLLKCVVITINKKQGKGENVDELAKFLRPLEKSYANFSQYVDDDATAFETLMDAYHSKNENAILLASKCACQPPLDTANLAIELLRLSTHFIDQIDPVITSDANIAVDMLCCCAKSCKYTIILNYKTITDKNFVKDCKKVLCQIQRVNLIAKHI